MIARLTGTMVHAGDRWVIIDVHGVGYMVQVTQPALRQLADTREPVTLLTHMVVREDAITLYGFRYQSERSNSDNATGYIAFTLKAFPGTHLGVN